MKPNLELKVRAVLEDEMGALSLMVKALMEYPSMYLTPKVREEATRKYKNKYVDSGTKQIMKLINKKGG